jgi:hypothetical protein
MRFLIFLLTALFFVGCEEEPVYSPPVDLLPEQLYMNVLTEVHLFNALVQSADSVANEDSLRLALYAHFEVTEQQFLESHAFYQSQPMQQTVRLDSISNRLKRSLDALNETRVLNDSLSGNNRVFQ